MTREKADPRGSLKPLYYQWQYLMGEDSVYLLWILEQSAC